MASILHIRPLMLILLLLATLSLPLQQLELLNISAYLSESLHTKCLTLAQKSPSYPDIYAAVGCGERIRNQSCLEIFRRTGLVHLMVVSGAHLWFIQSLVERLSFGSKLLKRLSLFLLAGFALTCGLNPPVTKALCFVIASKINQHLGLNYSRSWLCTLSGIACLVLFPSWWQSLSLQLSWVASLTLSTGNKISLGKLAKLYLTMFPILIVLGAPHPLSIVFSWALSPVFIGLLFPLILFNLIAGFEASIFLCDSLLTLYIDCLKLFSQNLPTLSPVVIPQHNLIIWLYLLGLNLFYLQNKRRSLATSH